MLSSRLILAAPLRSAVCGGCLIATFGLPAAAAAQVLYKSILPDGRIVYGDKPAPGAAKIIERQPDPSTAGLGGTSPREAQLLEDHVPAASHVLEKEAELRAVREVIDGLREGPEKETVRLFYLEGTLSAREIALRMGVGKSAVTMRLERFRAKIKAQLSERLAG